MPASPLYEYSGDEMWPLLAWTSDADIPNHVRFWVDVVVAIYPPFGVVDAPVSSLVFRLPFQPLRDLM